MNKKIASLQQAETFYFEEFSIVKIIEMKNMKIGIVERSEWITSYLFMFDFLCSVDCSLLLAFGRQTAARKLHKNLNSFRAILFDNCSS